MKNTVHQLVVVRAIVIKSEVVVFTAHLYQLYCMPASCLQSLVGWTGEPTFSILLFLLS